MRKRRMNLLAIMLTDRCQMILILSALLFLFGSAALAGDIDDLGRQIDLHLENLERRVSTSPALTPEKSESSEVVVRQLRNILENLIEDVSRIQKEHAEQIRPKQPIL